MKTRRVYKQGTIASIIQGLDHAVARVRQQAKHVPRCPECGAPVAARKCVEMCWTRRAATEGSGGEGHGRTRAPKPGSRAARIANNVEHLRRQRQAQQRKRGTTRLSRKWHKYREDDFYDDGDEFL